MIFRRKSKQKKKEEEMSTVGLDIFQEEDTNAQPKEKSKPSTLEDLDQMDELEEVQEVQDSSPETELDQAPKRSQKMEEDVSVAAKSKDIPEQEEAVRVAPVSEDVDELQEQADKPFSEMDKEQAGTAQPTEFEEGYSTDDEVLMELAKETGFEFLHIEEQDLPPEDLIQLFDVNMCKSYKIFPLRWNDDGSILIALADPLNVRTLDDIGIFLNKQVHGAIAPEDEIIKAIDEFFEPEGESIDDVFEALENADLEFDEETEDFGNLERIANEAPIVKLVNLLLLQAIKDRASDLHLEPYENSFRIRYRVDGTLHETPPPPRNLQQAIISRLKVLASMNIAERRLPQDGRITLSMSDREIDLRVSSLPTVNGESLVMRILDKTMMKLGLEQIGLLEDALQTFDQMIKNPNGIILVTGPTGSGKTTTLYSALDRIYSPELKIITTENPVEYQMDGVVQVNINPAVGLTFAACLRSILRQDPDVIMVGEIRDQETAQISIESALTGHLVLSTLHTNDAPSAVTRLIDMGIEPFLVTSSVKGVLAQRLIKTNCPNCMEEYQPQEEIMYDMGIPPDEVKEVTFYRGRGCTECNHSGYRGRIGIFEIFALSDVIYKMVLARESSSVIRKQARAEGMRTLREDGWEKIKMGLTTPEEVVRETL